MRKLALLFFLLVAATITFAQDDKIETDRPTEAQTPKTVSKGTFQAELGIRKEQQGGPDFSWQYPDAVFRYGLLKNLELRLQTTLETERFHSKNEFNSGLKPVEVGAKSTVFQNTDTSFVVALYGQIGLPQLASSDHQHHKTFYHARLLFENELTKKLSLNYNIGRGWNEEERTQNWMYAVAPQLEVADKWDVFLEAYGFLKKGLLPEHYVDGGVAYYISQNVKADVDAGKGLGGGASDYFITAGVSFRL